LILRFLHAWQPSLDLLCVRLGLERVRGASCTWAKSGRSKMKLIAVSPCICGLLCEPDSFATSRPFRARELQADT
jgi:hypothetical protein